MVSAVEVSSVDVFHRPELISKILDLSASLSERISLCGFPCKAQSKRSVLLLNSFEFEKLTSIFQQLSSTDLLVGELERNIEDPIHPEKNLIDKSLNFFNFYLRDDFWAEVTDTDIIQVFNSEGIQVFRTFNFFNYSGYSLADLLTLEWYHLWERPKMVLDSLLVESGNINTQFVLEIPLLNPRL